jgi:hypothetical protein
MNQYLDEKDGKWHVSLSVDIPRILVKNKLNFRLHSVVMKNGEVVRDPSLSSSRYIFGIAPSFMGKKGFFFSYFEPTEIEEVDQFNFGLCDERVRWYGNTIFSVKNEYIKNEIIIEPEIQQLIATDNVRPAERVQSEVDTEIIDCINSDNIAELNSALESIFIEPPLVSQLEALKEAPKKAPAKKAGRKKK